MSDVLPYPLINGYEPSFCSIEATIAGSGLVVPIPGIKSISYQDPLTDTYVYGNSPFPQGRTRGQLKPTGSIEFYRRQWAAAQAALSGGGAWGIAERSWVITVTYAETGFQTTLDVLEGVRVHSPDSSGSEGTDALTVKCTLGLMQIIWGGKARSLSPKNSITRAL